MARKTKTARPLVPAWYGYIWWAVPLLAIFVYIPVIDADFTLDDVLIVEENTYLRSLDKIPDIWTSHYWAGKVDATDKGLYRPLTLTTYNLQYVLHGNNPIPFHLINILLHALACLLVMQLVQLLFSDLRMAVITGLIFALHPVHTEAVAGIVGRAEILAAIFIVLTMICYHHYRKEGKPLMLAGLLFSAFGAISSKEHGFMLPAILLLQEAYYYVTTTKYVWKDRHKWIGLSALILLASSLWIFRSTITSPSVAHEAWRAIAPPERMATALRTTVEYINLHLWPFPLSADYWTDEVPVIGFGHLIALGCILFLAALVWVSIKWRSGIPAMSWGILFFLLTLLPVSNFLFAAGFLKAERILYIPSIGLITALSALLVLMFRRPGLQKAGYLVVCAGLLFFAGRTWIRAGDWQNNFTLAVATLKTSPKSPRFNNMMGLELRAQKKNQEALAYFQKAVQSNPNHVPALVNLGTEFRHIGRLPEAAATLERALTVDPNTLATYVNLMSVYRSMEAYDKNVRIAEQALQRFSQNAAVVWNAANAYQLKGDMSRANELRARARQLDPKIGGGN